MTVTYSGKGEVSAKNEISIFLFTDPNITEASMPVAVGVVEENGGHFLFKDLPPVVYIAVVYDDAGTYNRDSAPPPGTPVMLYGMASGRRAGGREAGQGRQGHRDFRRLEPDVASRRAGLAAFFFAAGQLSSRPSRRSASSPTAMA